MKGGSHWDTSEYWWQTITNCAEGLRSIVEGQPDWEIVGEANDGARLLTRPENFARTSQVVDISMPDERT